MGRGSKGLVSVGYDIIPPMIHIVQKVSTSYGFHNFLKHHAGGDTA